MPNDVVLILPNSSTKRKNQNKIKKDMNGCQGKKKNEKTGGDQ